MTSSIREGPKISRVGSIDAQAVLTRLSVVSVGDDYLTCHPFKSDGTVNTNRTVYVKRQNYSTGEIYATLMSAAVKLSTGKRTRLTDLVGMGVVRACLMSQTGGADGTTSTAATWTYQVTDIAGNVLAGSDVTPIDPVASPHKYRRPSKGTMVKATAGWYYYSSTGVFTILWCTEFADAGC